jgi:putative inorganic carbon (HCO3(-)) transporter
MIPGVIDPKTQKIGIQWLIVILLGLLLGIYILFTFKLSSKWIPLLLLAALFPFVVLAIGNLRKILLALILLDIPIQLDIAVGSSWILNYTGAINGYIISVTTICLVILYVLWMLEYLVNKDVAPHPLRRPNLYLTLYLAITCLSMVAGELQRLASFEIFLLVQIFLLYLYVINKIRKKKDLLFILVFLLVGLIGESLIIMLMQVMGQGFSVAGIMGNIYASAATPEGVSRIGGTLQSANTAGSYLSMLLAPAFSILVTQLNKPYKWLGAAAFLCGVIALILTGSRGAWIATFISFMLFGIFAFRRGWLEFRVVVIAAAIGILIGILFYGPLYERIFGYDSGAAASRTQQYHVALQIIRAHPVFGIGANNYFNALRQYLVQSPNSSVFRWVVHNKYLLVWAETGIFGLLFFVMFLISTIRQGFKMVQTSDSFLSPLALSFAAAIAGQMVHMFFDVFHGRSQVQLLWLVAGLIITMHYLCLQRTEEDAKQGREACLL